MTTIGSTSPATAATRGAAQDKETSSATIAADFQTFLTLLTTQMRNQDPLSPTDSTEYMSQLASFSGVEQQVRTNDRLDTIISALGNSSSAGLAEWIGREVRAPAAAAFDGQPITVGVTPDAKADRAVLVVTNAFGSEVATRTLPANATEAVWDGTDALGNPAPHGDYAFALRSYAGDTLLGTEAGTVYTTVREVRIADGTTTLVLADGTEVPVDAITALR